MTIVEYHVTPDHRYFMRRSKAEIVSKIEQMSGSRVEGELYAEMMAMSKPQLAERAMRIWRMLPRDPENPQ